MLGEKTEEGSALFMDLVGPERVRVCECMRQLQRVAPSRGHGQRGERGGRAGGRQRDAAGGGSGGGGGRSSRARRILRFQRALARCASPAPLGVGALQHGRRCGGRRQRGHMAGFHARHADRGIGQGPGPNLNPLRCRPRALRPRGAAACGCAARRALPPAQRLTGTTGAGQQDTRRREKITEQCSRVCFLCSFFVVSFLVDFRPRQSPPRASGLQSRTSKEESRTKDTKQTEEQQVEEETSQSLVSTLQCISEAER